MVEQLALAISPSCPSTASAFTSGTTSGTSGSSLKSLPLSMTTAPREMASRASCTAAPFSPSVPAKKARSTPSKASGSATPTSKASPASTAVRALLARTRNSLIGKSRRLNSATNLSPTSPAPTTATVYPSPTTSSRIPETCCLTPETYNRNLQRLMRDIQQIPHHPARGAFRAGAGTSHGEGNIRVAACAEVEYVLGTADGTERTLYRRVLQTDLDRATLRDTHQIAEHVVFLDREQACRERLVVLGKAPHELLQRHVFQAFGDQRLV